MQLRLSTGLFAALVIISQTVSAAIVTYDVDLGGTSNFGNSLRLFGTITVDADLATQQGVIGSSLQVQRESETPLSLPNLPAPFGGVNPSLDWVVDGDDLYITRIANSPTAILRWEVSGESPTRRFRLGAATEPHLISLANDLVVLKDISGPDGPLGFRVGTASAVPEPSSLVALTCVGAAIALRRKRRPKSRT